MTKEQKFALQRDNAIVRNALEKALFVYEEIDFDFFEKAAEGGRDVVMQQLPRYKAFYKILGDLLNEIGANLCSEEWIEKLEAEDNE